MYRQGWRQGAQPGPGPDPCGEWRRWGRPSSAGGPFPTSGFGGRRGESLGGTRRVGSLCSRCTAMPVAWRCLGIADPKSNLLCHQGENWGQEKRQRLGCRCVQAGTGGVLGSAMLGSPSQAEALVWVKKKIDLKLG